MSRLNFNVTNPSPTNFNAGARQGPAGPGTGGGLDPIGANTLLGNNTGSPALPIALTPAQVSTLLNLVGTYLALTGGTLTGALTVAGTVRLNTIGGSGTWVQIRSTSSPTNPEFLFENSANGVIASLSSTGGLTFVPFAASHTPSANNRLTFERVSDTSLNVVYRGNDGTTRRRDLFVNVESFETVSQSLSAFPAAISYSSGRISSIVYTLPGPTTITKTINYTGDRVTSIVLSGATPAGISLTKTITYTGDNITGIAYS